ncbi:MAG TPA: PmoA family protein [Verrucomicrobiae bacterium]
MLSSRSHRLPGLFTLLLLTSFASAQTDTPERRDRSRLKLDKQNDRLIISSQTATGEWIELAIYQMAPGTRPYLHPVKDASGSVTLTEDRPADHPWQHGIFTGFHRVNGLNYWKEDEGKQRFVRLLETQTNANQVSWTALIELVTPDGKAVLEEENRIVIHAPEPSGAYLIDFDLLLRAKQEDVNFGKFFVGGLSVRMPWDKENPRQTHLNSEGIRGRAAEQKRASWCTVERPFDKEVFGIAILDHPSNPGYPSAWRVDEQGLINPNISGLSDWTLPAKTERRFRYRILIYRGATTTEHMAGRFNAFEKTR